jgi:DUF4097 and DUF4098 domain-containing protein YvlB
VDEHTQEQDMTEHHFDTPQPASLYVEIGKGTVRIAATDTDTTHVEVTGRDADQVRVEQSGDQISVVAPQRTGFLGGDSRLDVTITLPTDSDLAVKTGSADITVDGTLGSGKIKSGSGDVQLDTFGGPALVDTGSGDIRLESARAELRIKSGSGSVNLGSVESAVAVSTGSGDVEIGSANGPTVVKTGSGDLKVATANADVSLSTGSGDLSIGSVRRGRISVKGASSDLHIGIPAGTPVWADINTVTGSVRSNLESVGAPQEGQEHVELQARTVSGDITIREV